MGALGIPVRGLRLLTMRRHGFHDVKLSSLVRNAYQAVAIDERRAPFKPSIWQAIPKPESTEGRPWGQPLKKLEGAPLNLG